MATQKEDILKFISDKRWHHIITISQAVRPGSVGMAVAQQISKLKKEGHEIDSRIAAGGNMAEYRLVRTKEEVQRNELPLNI